jgi:hypothetical protein
MAPNRRATITLIRGAPPVPVGLQPFRHFNSIESRSIKIEWNDSLKQQLYLPKKGNRRC